MREPCGKVYFPERPYITTVQHSMIGPHLPSSHDRRYCRSNPHSLIVTDVNHEAAITGSWSMFSALSCTTLANATHYPLLRDHEGSNAVPRREIILYRFHHFYLAVQKKAAMPIIMDKSLANRAVPLSLDNHHIVVEAARASRPRNQENLIWAPRMHILPAIVTDCLGPGRDGRLVYSMGAVYCTLRC